VGVSDDVLTQTIPVSQARQRLGALVNAVYKRHVRVVVEKSGIPVVALVALPDLERWLRLERQWGPADQGSDGGKEMTMSREQTVVSPPTKEELARRQKLAAEIRKLREQSNIAPLTTADLVHQVREEEIRSYGDRR
jgi:prevent-host-death family protein